MTRRERKKARNRKRLYQAALTLFRQQGYDATTVRAITDRADLGKSTFFNYFPSKESVLAVYYREVTEDMLDHARRLDDASVRERLEALLRRGAQHVTTDAPLFRHIAAMTRGQGALADEDRALDREMLTFFRELTEQGIARGELRPDVDASLFGAVVLALMSSTAEAWALAEDEVDLERALLNKLDLVLRGAEVASEDVM